MRNILLLFACLSGISFVSCSVEQVKQVEKVEQVEQVEQAILVTCQTVETTTIVDSSEFTGLIEAKEQANIAAKNEGTISQILVKPGEKVVAGTDLFLLNTGSQIKSPISGIVSNISVNRGEFITKGQALTRVIDNQTLELNIGVPTENSSQLKIGLPVEIIAPPHKASLKGKIDFVSPEINRRYILVKATLRNNGNFRDNQEVIARIIWWEELGILIPTTAISRIAGQNFVFVAEEVEQKGEITLLAKQRIVELRNIQGQSYQVISGLEAGEKLITSGILNLTDGTPVKCRDNDLKN